MPSVERRELWNVIRWQKEGTMESGGNFRWRVSGNTSYGKESKVSVASDRNWNCWAAVRLSTLNQNVFWPFMKLLLHPKRFRRIEIWLLIIMFLHRCHNNVVCYSCTQNYMLSFIYVNFVLILIVWHSIRNVEIK